MLKRCARQAISLLMLFGRCYCQQSIYSGQGFATYYYDIEKPEACAKSLSVMNSSPSKCGLSADAIDSNNIVAINLTQLSSDMTMFCGKQVVISVNEKVSDLPLFVADGCERCTGGSSDVWNPAAAPGLDLSYSALNELADGAACDKGYIKISWELRDVLLYDFNSNIAKSQEVLATLATSSPTPAISPICSEGSWRCGHNDDILEQCLVQSWMPRATCAADYTCQGDANPYCVHT